MVAWALYDFGNSAYSAVIQTFVFAAYFAQAVVGDDERGQAYWGWTIGGAGLAVALIGPVLGAMADQGGRRKPWLVGFSAACIAGTAAMWLVEPEAGDLWLAVALAAGTTVASELAVIFYNAMLPGLAGVAPGTGAGAGAEGEAPGAGTPPGGKVGRWSGWGWAAGYAGGVLALVIAYFGLIAPPAGLWPNDVPLGVDVPSGGVRATFVLAAAWFAAFAWPLAVWTPDEPGTGKALGVAARDGLAQLASSLRHVREYGHIARFLVAKMLYIDGLTTMFAIGGVYAATTFDFTDAELLRFGIALNVTGAIGAGALSLVDDRIGGRNLVLLCLAGLMLSAGAMLAVESKAAFWAGALVLGLFVGPVQSGSRSYLARVSPAGMRNEMFGLYALSGKATAFAGPLLVGWVTLWTGSTRWGMSVVLGLFAAGFAVLWTVPRGAEGGKA